MPSLGLALAHETSNKQNRRRLRLPSIGQGDSCRGRIFAFVSECCRWAGVVAMILSDISWQVVRFLT